MFVEGFLIALKPINLLYLLAGNFFGLIIGVLPAVGAAFGVAVMLPFTFGMDPVSALIFLCAIHATGCYGDSVTSILTNIPGSPVSVPSCWDGYALTRQGRGGMALGIAAFGSFLGGLFGWILLIAIAKPLTAFAIEIGAPEYFALGVMALGLVSIASKEETLKGILWASVGIVISCVGADPIAGLTSRFSFGILSLEGGIPVVISMLGLFALSQVTDLFEKGPQQNALELTAARDRSLAGVVEILKRPMTVARSAIVGLFIGILPALGTTLATVTGYLVEKKYSRERDEFGRGAVAGLTAAEVSKGSCVVGDLIPSFTLGIPGSLTGAILMGALIIHGIQPGPMFMQSGSLPYAIFAGILLTQACLLITGFSVAKYFAKVALVPNAILAPVVLVLCFLGAYVERNTAFDVGAMIVLGVLGFLSEKARYPTVSLLLGVLLGPLVEVNFHRALRVGLGSYSIFFTRPICLAIIVATLAFLAWPFVSSLFRRKKADASLAATAESKTKAPASVEVALLTFAILLFGLVLWKSGEYSRDAALLPRMASVVGLALSLYLLAPALRALFRSAPLPASSEPSQAGVSAWLSFAGYVVYLFLFLLLGLPLATGVYVLVASRFAGYRRWQVSVPTAAGLTASLYFVGQALQIPLAGLISV
ncbi:MAG: tripartite tricarboxylate transporter permease [Deltaproteobacteria bacterium]|nr:tripartite tricarboxylate transporter permease [Deltaproteobacteria bacterium]